MVLKYDVVIKDSVIEQDLIKITDKIYKLLPTREEGNDWTKLLQTLIIELTGMSNLFIGKQDLFLPLLCKLEGLFSLQDKDQFLAFRRTIFDCLNLMNSLLAACR